MSLFFVVSIALESPVVVSSIVRTVRGDKIRDDRKTRRLPRQESLHDATTMVCHRMCDYHRYSPEEEERLTTMVTTTGEQAQGEGCHYDTTTRMTAMTTVMQDRLQERSPVKRPTTSLDYVIRLTDRLQEWRLKLFRFFSHGSRAGTAMRRDTKQD